MPYMLYIHITNISISMYFTWNSQDNIISNRDVIIIRNYLLNRDVLLLF